MRPHDAQAEVVREIDALLAEPDLDAEELERFIGTGLITQTTADEMLADRKGHPR